MADERRVLNIAPVSNINRAKERFHKLAVEEVDALKLRNPAHLTENQRALIQAHNDLLFQQAERSRFADGR